MNPALFITVKQVFSDMDFIGWYTTGDTPSTGDIKIHKQICEINESPIMMKLNPYDKNIDVIITLLIVTADFKLNILAPASYIV